MANSITVRKNDPVTNDPDFTTTLADLDAVTQIIKTTILLFMGEWWENIQLGTPMFQNILGIRGATANSVSAILQNRILSVPFVTGLTNVSSSYSSAAKNFSFSADVQTQFGTVTITFPQNGSSAAIGES